jgi:hypothetical protein
MARNSLKRRQVSAARMPGFNAEASLYMSPATYRSSGSPDGTIGAVQPASTCWYCTPFGCEPVPCKIRTHI